MYPIYALALTLSIALLVTLNIHPMSALDKLRQIMSDPAAFIIMMWTSACVFGQEMLFSLGISPEGDCISQNPAATAYGPTPADSGMVPLS